MDGRLDPQTLLQQAALHQRAGRWPDAIAAYEAALQQAPDRPNSWFNLGYVCRRAGRFEAALAAYQQALSHGVQQAEEVHLNRGVIYADDLRRPEAAERELQAALALNPVYQPALLNLANLQEDQGHREAALAVYERLLQAHPDSPDGLARYAVLRGATDPADPIIERLRAAIGNAATPLADRATLGFALGQVLDRCQAYDAAFAAYQSANVDSAASLQSQQPLYDPDAHERLIDALIRTYRRADGPCATPQGPPPLFICGMFRSGSTLAEQILAGHPAVIAGGEHGFIPQWVASQSPPYPAGVAQLTALQLEDLAERYRLSMAPLARDGRRVTDKRPDNFLHIGLIKSLFPHARIVHTRRHPLDNGLSVYFLHLDQRMGYALDLAHIGHYFSQYRRLMAHWQSIYGDDILDFDYDALVREPRPSIERLLQFCGLPWDARCLNFEQVRNTVRTASVWQVRQALYTQSSGRWRHYERHIEPLRRALGDGHKPPT